MQVTFAKDASSAPEVAEAHDSHVSENVISPLAREIFTIKVRTYEPKMKFRTQK